MGGGDADGSVPSLAAMGRNQAPRSGILSIDNPAFESVHLSHSPLLACHSEKQQGGLGGI